jgi:endonuclease/exonuclease/phosphatase family metal-dependent hydrolase
MNLTDMFNGLPGLDQGYYNGQNVTGSRVNGTDQAQSPLSYITEGSQQVSGFQQDRIDLSRMPVDPAALKNTMIKALRLDSAADAVNGVIKSQPKTTIIDAASLIPGGQDFAINQIRQKEDLDKNWPYDAGNVKIMNLNCHRLQETNVIDLARYIKNNQVDVMALQEIPADKAKQLQKLLGPEWQVKTQDTIYPDMNGKAILSRYKITDYQDKVFDKSQNAGEFERRGVQHAQIQVGDRTINVFNAHLTNTGEDDGKRKNRMDERKYQLRQLEEYIRQEEAGHSGSSVVMGDFNQRGGLGGVTNGRTDFNDSSVDHIIISNDLAEDVLSHYFKDENLSDHEPIFAQFNLNQ